MSTDRLALGIDQGGSGTRVLLSDSGGILLGRGDAPGGCHTIDGMATVMDHIRKAVGYAMLEAQCDIGSVGSAVAGLTGADWPHEYHLLRRELQKMLGIEVTIVNDSLIALHAETSGPGIVVCAGSGMNCAVRSMTGETFVFGYAVRDSDQGGTALGNEVYWAVIDEASGKGRATILSRLLLEHLGLPSTEDLLFHRTSGLLDEPLHRWVPMLNEAISTGDAVAKGISAAFGRRMAEYAAAGVRKFGMQTSDTLVVLAGGVWRNAASCMVESFTEALLLVAPRSRIVISHKQPVEGALKMALHLVAP